jgi:hypothetical protein
MIRTIVITTLLAAAGAAHAESIKVSLAGKTEAGVKVEVAKASTLVCRDVAATEYAACVRETYQDAMAKVARLKAMRTASLTF